MPDRFWGWGLAAFIIVRALDGSDVTINSEQITSMHRGRDGESNKVLTNRVRCVVGLSNAKFVSSVEDCDDILRRIEGAR